MESRCGLASTILPTLVKRRDFTTTCTFADPGVKYKQLEKMTLQGKNYNVIGVTFGKGVGESPEGEYRLLVDPESNRMEWLLYTVTFFNGQPSANDQFNAYKYKGYQEHQGLLFPQELKSYTYKNSQIGDLRYSVRIKDLQLKEQQPDPHLHKVFLIFIFLQTVSIYILLPDRFPKLRLNLVPSDLQS